MITTLKKIEQLNTWKQYVMFLNELSYEELLKFDKNIYKKISYTNINQIIHECFELPSEQKRPNITLGNIMLLYQKEFPDFSWNELMKFEKIKQIMLQLPDYTKARSYMIDLIHVMQDSLEQPTLLEFLGKQK